MAGKVVKTFESRSDQAAGLGVIDDGVETRCWQTEFSSALDNDIGSFRARGP